MSLTISSDRDPSTMTVRAPAFYSDSAAAASDPSAVATRAVPAISPAASRVIVRSSKSEPTTLWMLVPPRQFSSPDSCSPQ